MADELDETENVVRLREAGRRKQTNAALLKVQLSLSKGHRGKTYRQTFDWSALCERLSVPTRDKSYTMEQYVKLSLEDQGTRKNVDGYYVGGIFADGSRDKKAMVRRTIATLDIDDATPAVFEAYSTGSISGLSAAEYFMHTTRKHTPEKPRFRLLIPFTNPIPVDEGEAVSRYLAQMVDPTMRTVDSVSFVPNQVMFFPTVNSDGQFTAYRNRGVVIDPADILARNKWHPVDYPAPRTPNEKKDHAALGKGLANPLEKPGIVGQWCRSWSIAELIDGPLSDLYKPAGDDSGRYTHVNATGPAGVVIHEDGHLTSHHSSDPVAGRTVNAWDLFMACRFGALDSEDDLAEVAAGRKQQTKLPSYRAMVRHAEKDERVAALMEAEALDLEAIADDIFEGDDPEPVIVERSGGEAKKVTLRPYDPDWMDRLDRNEKTKAVKNTFHNIVLVLKNDKRLAHKFGYNELREKMVLIGQVRSKKLEYSTGPIRDKANGDLITDRRLISIKGILSAKAGRGSSGYGLDVGLDNLRSAVSAAAEEHSFHPIKNVIEAEKWDMTPRIGRFFATYFKAADTPFVRAVSRRFLLALVARIYQPGHKFDFVPVIQSVGEGIGKSTGFKALVGAEFFVELRTGFDDVKKLGEAISGKWLIEIAELAGLRKSEQEAVKAALSATSDQYREAYGHEAAEFKRQCIFVGTTNEKAIYWPGENRRFWTMALEDNPRIDVAGIRRDRRQLLAEALVEFNAESLGVDDGDDIDLSLPPEEHQEGLRLAREHVISGVDTELVEKIRAWLDAPVTFEEAQPGYRSDLMDDPIEGERTPRNRFIYLDLIWAIWGVGPEHRDFGRYKKMAEASLREINEWISPRTMIRVKNGGGLQRPLVRKRSLR